MKKAIVLLSGGLDSSTALYVAKNEGFDEVYALTFEYGQKHDKEIESAKAVARAAGVKEHKFVRLLLNQWGDCSLTNPAVQIDKGNVNRTDIPATYVPARNMVFLSVAASYADALEISDLFIGVSETDYSGYVDCRESFIKAMEEAVNLGTVLGAEKKRRITIHAPLTDATNNMINERALSMMKPTAVLINAARGGIVDEAALYMALKEHRIYGAALDATEIEPACGSPLALLDNCILTPHAGAATREASLKMGLLAAQNVIDVLRGKECRYIVNE